MFLGLRFTPHPQAKMNTFLNQGTGQKRTEFKYLTTLISNRIRLDKKGLPDCRSERLKDNRRGHYQPKAHRLL